MGTGTGTAQGKSSPRRGPQQARRQAMGPTAAEGRYLRERWGKASAEELAAQLHIGRATVYRWAVKLGVYEPSSRKRWSAHEIGTLDGLVSTSSIHSIARQIV